MVAILDKGTIANITQGMMVDYSIFDEFFLLCYSFVFYFYKLFVPFSLAAVYVYPPKINGHLPLMYYFSPVILAILAFLLFKARRNRNIILGAGLFLITISLNVQIIPSRLFIVTERYAYFPYIGLFFIIGMFYAELAKKKSPLAKNLRTLIISALVLYTVAFSYTICQRNKIWDNDIPFMTDILAKNPEVPYLSRAYGNLGHAYFQQNNYEEAIKDFNQAIRLKPDDAQTYYNRGLCYTKIPDFRKAILDFDIAARYDPKQFIIYSNRAVARYNLKDYPGTIADCDLAIRCDSSQYEIYNTRAASEYYMNDMAAAERDFTRSIALNPNFPDSYKNRGNLYHTQNRLTEACTDWKKAASMGNAEAQKAVEQYCR